MLFIWPNKQKPGDRVSWHNPRDEMTRVTTQFSYSVTQISLHVRLQAGLVDSRRKYVGAITGAPGNHLQNLLAVTH